MTSCKAILLLSVFLLASLSLALAQGTYTQIDVPGSLYTYCEGINQAGDVVGQYTDSQRIGHGFVLAGGTYTTIDYPGAQETGLSQINDFGKIVGYADNLGFLYDVKTQQFTEINFPGATTTVATAINNAGWIVGFAQFEGSYSQAFALIGSTYYPAKPSFGNEYFYGISAKGEMVGYIQKNDRVVSFSFYQGKYRQINIPNVSFVFGINSAGTALVGDGNMDGSTNGFIYQNSILEWLPQFEGYGVMPQSVNNGGEVVGAFIDSSGHEHGFTWTQ